MGFSKNYTFVSQSAENYKVLDAEGREQNLQKDRNPEGNSAHNVVGANSLNKLLIFEFLGLLTSGIVTTLVFLWILLKAKKNNLNNKATAEVIYPASILFALGVFLSFIFALHVIY